MPRMQTTQKTGRSFNIVEAIANTNPAKLKEILNKAGFIEHQKQENIAGADWQIYHHFEIAKPFVAYQASIGGDAKTIPIQNVFDEKKNAELTFHNEGDGEFSLVYQSQTSYPVKFTILVVGPDTDNARMIVVHEICVGEPIKPSKLKIGEIEGLEGKKHGDKIMASVAYAFGWDYVAVKYVTK